MTRTVAPAPSNARRPGRQTVVDDVLSFLRRLALWRDPRRRDTNNLKVEPDSTPPPRASHVWPGPRATGNDSDDGGLRPSSPSGDGGVPDERGHRERHRGARARRFRAFNRPASDRKRHRHLNPLEMRQIGAVITTPRRPDGTRTRSLSSDADGDARCDVRCAIDRSTNDPRTILPATLGALDERPVILLSSAHAQGE